MRPSNTLDLLYETFKASTQDSRLLPAKNIGGKVCGMNCTHRDMLLRLDAAINGHALDVYHIHDGIGFQKQQRYSEQKTQMTAVGPETTKPGKSEEDHISPFLQCCCAFRTLRNPPPRITPNDIFWRDTGKVCVCEGRTLNPRRQNSTPLDFDENRRGSNVGNFLHFPRQYLRSVDLSRSEMVHLSSEQGVF